MFNYDSMKGKTIVAVRIHCIDCGREMGMREGGSRSSVYYVCDACGKACSFQWETNFYPLAEEEGEMADRIIETRKKTVL